VAGSELARLADKTARLIVKSKKIVVFTGAGISTESGIPDFRSPGGFWEKNDPDDFTIQRFIADPENRRRRWQGFREGRLTEPAEPNAAHYAVAELHRLGRLYCVITQNVDNLHLAAGVPADMIFELHGNMQRAACMGCGRRYPIAEVMSRLDDGETTLDCPACGGILKPDVVMFGEQLPSDVLNRAAAHAASCDLFIVIGSSLVVYPAAYMPEYALGGGARLVIINLSPTALDGMADVVIPVMAGEAMSVIAGKVAEMMDG
jgi:NAD-dependent deacetylase